MNREKTQVAQVRSVKYLGRSFYVYKGKGRLRIQPKSMQKLKDKIREITGRSIAMGMEASKIQLNQVVRGWKHDCGQTQEKAIGALPIAQSY